MAKETPKTPGDETKRILRAEVEVLKSLRGQAKAIRCGQRPELSGPASRYEQEYTQKIEEAEKQLAA